MSDAQKDHLDALPMQDGVETKKYKSIIDYIRDLLTWWEGDNERKELGQGNRRD